VKLLEIYEGDNSYYLITDYYEGDTLYNFIRNTQSDTLPSYIVRDGIKVTLNSLYNFRPYCLVFNIWSLWV